MKTGEMIRLWRVKLEMTQEQFALEASLYQSQLSNYENCLIIPTRKVLTRIADALGVPPESLEGDDMERRTRA